MQIVCGKYHWYLDVVYKEKTNLPAVHFITGERWIIRGPRIVLRNETYWLPALNEQWALVSADASASLGFFLPSMTTMTRHLLTEKKGKEQGGRENDIPVSNNPSALDVAAMNETIDGE